MSRRGDGSPIIIVGPTGVGKTDAGRALARLLGVPFVDTDDLVAAQAGVSGEDAFAALGEVEFRGREAVAVRDAMSLGRAVVALGGGALLDPAVRSRVARARRVVVLVADEAALLDRLRRRPRAALGEGAAARRAGLRRRLDAARGLGPQVGANGSPDEVAARVAATLGLDAAGARPAEWEVVIDVGHARCLALGRPRALTGGPDAARGAAALNEGLARCLGAPPPRRALVVSSPLAWALFGRPLRDLIGRAGLSIASLTLVPDGERAKTPAWLSRIWRQWAACRAERRDIVIALGGGAVSDAAGLAAATYLRGLPWAAFPTTLLAQLDAAVGGKVAVNLDRGKNLIGAFHQPCVVVIDPAALASLPPRRLADGMAEAVKCGLLAGGELWDLVATGAGAARAGDPDALGRVARLCLGVKARVVAADERESGPREALNLGHTVGHALEAAARWPHGRAVAAGLAVACRLAGDGALAREVAAVLRSYRLPTGVPPRLAPAVLELVAWDKKTRGGRLRFVLPLAPGRVRRGVPVGRAALAAALSAREMKGATE